MTEQAEIRVCGICGASLEGRDPRTEVCSPRCRIERSRIRRLMVGRYPGPWPSLEHYKRRNVTPRGDG
jgi:hypothetical protein